MYVCIGCRLLLSLICAVFSSILMIRVVVRCLLCVVCFVRLEACSLLCVARWVLCDALCLPRVRNCCLLYVVRNH